MGLRNRIRNLLGASSSSRADDDAMVLAGRHLATLMKSSPIGSLADAEFKVFSQWGDDGIIQYLIDKVSISKEAFIEFGVENYTEANTKFLLMSNHWKGLIIDGNPDYMNAVRASRWFWKYELTAVSEFITRDNINGIFRNSGFSGPIGLLSIDVDGNDYWIWNEINSVDADIIIVEYNSLFGSVLPVTIPYDPSFNRTQAHYSNLYWGVSLPALVDLGERKGYVFVGSNLAGNNAYFVKTEKAGLLRRISAKEGYRESRFRESRDQRGNLTYLSGTRRLQEIAEMNIVDLRDDKLKTIRELYSL